MSWFYLALLAPLLYACVNLVDDNLIRFVDRGPMFVTTTAGFFGALPLVSLLFKPLGHMPLHISAFAVAAGLLTTVYFYLYFKALEIEVPSIVIAMFALTPAIVPFLAHIFLGEKLVHGQIVGLILVLLASFFLAAVDIREFKFSKALWLIVIAAVLLSIISIFTKYVYQNVPFYPGYMGFALGMGLGGFYFLLVLAFSGAKKAVGDIRANLKQVVSFIVLGELFGLGAEFVMNLAISRGPVSLVKAIEGTQPIYLLLIAILLYPFAPKYFREATEGRVLRKLGLMLLSVLGLYLISLTA